MFKNRFIYKNHIAWMCGRASSVRRHADDRASSDIMVMLFGEPCSELTQRHLEDCLLWYLHDIQLPHCATRRAVCPGHNQTSDSEDQIMRGHNIAQTVCNRAFIPGARTINQAVRVATGGTQNPHLCVRTPRRTRLAWCGIHIAGIRRGLH